MLGNYKKIYTFIILTFILSCYPYYVIISNGSLEGVSSIVLLLMWIPGLSALITKLVFDKNLRCMGWRLGKLKYIIISYLIPLVACIIVYSLVWSLRMGSLDIKQLQTYQEGDGSTLFYLVVIIVLATLGVVGSAISAFGEELGWRGFLVPELSKHLSYTKVSLISGVIWNIYHYPILLFSDYNNANIVSSLLFFTISIFAVSFIATYLRLASGSLWTGVILHASHNMFVQGVFDLITVDKGYTRYVTTEFGIGLMIIYVIVAIYYFSKKSNLPVIQKKHN